MDKWYLELLVKLLRSPEWLNSQHWSMKNLLSRELIQTSDVVAIKKEILSGIGWDVCTEYGMILKYQNEYEDNKISQLCPDHTNMNTDMNKWSI